MKRVNSMSRPNSRILLYFALYVILTFLLFGCGSSSSGSGSDADASSGTGSIVASLEFQDNQETPESISAADAEFACEGNGVGWVRIEVLDENNQILAHEGVECIVGEAICTGIEPGSNRKVRAIGKASKDSLLVLYEGETTEPITIIGGETKYIEEKIKLYKMNRSPVADAGLDQTVLDGERVNLNSFGSFDWDGDIESYEWTQIDGPTVELSGRNGVQSFFIAPEDVGPNGVSLIFRLTVTDDGNLQATDDIIVHVTYDNDPPTANAGSDQTVAEAVEVKLDGSKKSNDPDGVIDSYLWTQTEGPQVDLSNKAAAQPTFTAPEVDPKGAVLTFELLVTDNGGLKATDKCIVNVLDATLANTPPIAVPGTYQEAKELETVTLDGFESYDPDPGDGIISYLWTQTYGPEVALYNRGTVKAKFEAPEVDSKEDILTFELLVADSGGLKGIGETSVSVENVCQPPELDPIGPKSVDEGALLEFTVTATDDDAGDELTFSAEDLPQGAGFDPNTQLFSWTPGEGQPGNYQVKFVVTDSCNQLTDFEVVPISVGNVCQPPDFQEKEPQAANALGTLSFRVFAWDEDPDAVLTYRAEDLPQGATFNPDTRLFSWTPNEYQQGDYQVKFVVSDNCDPPLSDSMVVPITVGPPCEKPKFDPPPASSYTIEEKERLSFQVTATDPDPGSVLTYDFLLYKDGKYVYYPDRAGINQTYGWFNFTPNCDDTGEYEVRFQVNNDCTAPLYDYMTIPVTVTDMKEPNQLPEIDVSPDSYTVEYNQIFYISFYAADPDSSKENWVVSAKPQYGYGYKPDGSRQNRATVKEDIAKGEGWWIFEWSPGTDCDSYHHWTFWFTIEDNGCPEELSNTKEVYLTRKSRPSPYDYCFWDYLY